MNKNITTVYRHFDKRGVLLYVGISNDPKRRLAEHKNKRWFRLIHKVTEKQFKTRGLALKEEERAIKSEDPIYNKVYNNENRIPGYLTTKYLGEIEKLLYVILVGYLVI